ncbi:MAG: cytochrome c [Polyangiaceae bacterium]
MTLRFRLLTAFSALPVALILGACAAPADLGSCPTNVEAATLTAGEQAIQSECNGCHGFNTTQLDLGTAQDIYDKVETGDMPPRAPLSDTEVEEIRAFLACETSQ